MWWGAELNERQLGRDATRWISSVFLQKCSWHCLVHKPQKYILQLIRGINNSNMALKMVTLLSNNKYVYIVHNVKTSRRQTASLVFVKFGVKYFYEVLFFR